MLRIIVRKIPSTTTSRTLKNKKIHKIKISASRNYSSKNLCPPPKKRSKATTGTLYTLGAIALAGGATLGYARHSPEFREQLVCTVPALDEFLKIICGEVELGEVLSNVYQALKASLYNALTSKSQESAFLKQKKDYTAPPPMVPGLGPEPKDDKFSEIRTEELSRDGECIDVVIGGVIKPTLEELPETNSKKVIDVEETFNSSATEAINAYNRAVFTLKKFNQDVECVVEDSIDRISTQKWASIKAKSREKDEAVEIAKEKAKVASQDAAKLSQLVNQPSYEVRENNREMILANIKKIETDMANAKAELDKETKMGAIAYKYWEKVVKARTHFSEELESLFPQIDLQSKELKINSEDIDLFLMHAYSHVLYYQKELARAETLAQEKLAKAVEVAKKGGGEPLTAAQICEALEQEKRRITLCFQKQCLKLRKESECHLREQLKLQSQAFSDHLEDALKQKEMEIDRGLARKFDEKLEEEKCRFKMQLAAMIGRLRGLDRSLKIREVADEELRKSQILWSACQSLLRALKSTCPGLPWQTQLRPLTQELHAVKKSAAADDELVKAVLAALPEEARERGVFPEDALRERFLKVEEVARTVSLVSEEGSALLVYIMSYVQALLLFKSPSPIPQAELNNEATDFSELSTHDILQRARYWLDRGNFMQTLRYMNLLKGASRSVSRQWMNEARILLETQQAANTLMAHASSSGLMYL